MLKAVLCCKTSVYLILILVGRQYSPQRVLKGKQRVHEYLKERQGDLYLKQVCDRICRVYKCQILFMSCADGTYLHTSYFSSLLGRDINS